MPEMTVTVRWPGGTVTQHYSPSLVMHDHLTAGTTYSVSDFTERSTTALAEASERVRARFGYACTSSAASAAQIQRIAASHAPGEVVEVLAMEPPLPADA